MMSRAAEEATIRELLRRGRQLLAAPAEDVDFETGLPEAEKALNDISRYPHLFVLGCVMDRQIPFGRAWAIPYRVGQALGGCDFRLYRRVTAAQYKTLFVKNRYHRFNAKMADAFYRAVKDIEQKYDGDAGRIWRGKPSSALVVRRFLEFHGVGIKIATMAANILVRHFKVPMSDHSSIDISPDSRVRRYFVEKGLIRPGATPEEIVYRAREISPRFPGLLDYAAFMDGGFRRSAADKEKF
jgi:hypothetical protein